MTSMAKVGLVSHHIYFITRAMMYGRSAGVMHNQKPNLYERCIRGYKEAVCTLGLYDVQ